MSVNDSAITAASSRGIRKAMDSKIRVIAGGGLEPPRGTLHLDPVDDRSGKASGWRLNQHREQVVGSHFGFEVGASGTG